MLHNRLLHNIFLCWFAPIHKFQDLKTIRAEIKQIPSSTLTDPVKDPKELLFEFNGKENISPLKRNNQEKEKIQADTSDNMDEVMEVIKKKQGESAWEVPQHNTPLHENSS